MPYPAHRLDMYTSGVVIVAKQQPSVVRLHEMFRSGLHTHLESAQQSLSCSHLLHIRLRFSCSSSL